MSGRENRPSKHFLSSFKYVLGKLPDFWSLYSGLTDVPEKIAKLFLIISLCVISLAAILLSALPTSSPWQILPTIVISVATSSLSAALYTIASSMRELWLKENEKNSLLELLSGQISSKDFFIVLPRFPTTLLDSLRKIIQPKEQQDEALEKGLINDLYLEILKVTDANSCSKSLLLSDTDFASAEDLKSAMHIISLFESVGLKIPQIRFDDDALRELNTATNTTFISVGLESNSLTMQINAESESQRLFKIFKSDTENVSFVKIASIQGRDIVMDDKLDESRNCYFASSNSGIGLIAKICRNHNNNVVLILGALGAPGTSRVGQYFKDYWKEIKEWKDPSLRGEAVDCNPFAGVLSLGDSWITQEKVRVKSAR